MAFHATHPTLDLAALVASVRHTPPGCDRLVISPNAFMAARETLGAEIARATGAELHIAEIAAGGFLQSPTDPMAALGDIYSGRNSTDLSQAQAVLRAWLDATAQRKAA